MLLANAETLDIEIAQCPSCSPIVSSRIITTVFGILGAVAFCGVIVFGTLKDGLIATFVCIGIALLLFAIAIIAAVWPRSIRIARINGELVWFKGISEEFRRGLPDYANHGMPLDQQQKVAYPPFHAEIAFCLSNHFGDGICGGFAIHV